MPITFSDIFVIEMSTKFIEVFSPGSLQLPFAGLDDAADNLQQHSHHLL